MKENYILHDDLCKKATDRLKYEKREKDEKLNDKTRDFYN